MEWISIEDRLPETNKLNESDYYLCIDECKNQFVAWYNSKLDGWIVAHHKSDSDILTGIFKPTHYHPLPNPPKNKE